VIDQLADARLPTKVCCRVLGVSAPGYYKYKHRPLAPTQMRHAWLTGLIREVHTASRGTYGPRRVHAELTLGMGVQVNERLVSVLMTMNGMAGLPGPGKVRRLHAVVTAGD
jgi:putative transposase